MKAAKPAPAAHGGTNWRDAARPQRGRRGAWRPDPPADPWKLPSGENLAEFALKAGVVAPGLMDRRDGGRKTGENP
jgi:hypothetical protein